jgi:hypothetical protein
MDAELLRSVTERIREEHRKYANKEGIDWAEIAAAKVISEVKDRFASSRYSQFFESRKTCREIEIRVIESNIDHFLQQYSEMEATDLMFNKDKLPTLLFTTQQSIPYGRYDFTIGKTEFIDSRIENIGVDGLAPELNRYLVRDYRFIHQQENNRPQSPPEKPSRPSCPPKPEGFFDRFFGGDERGL